MKEILDVDTDDSEPSEADKATDEERAFLQSDCIGGLCNMITKYNQLR
jgi:hypothetical protein